MHIIYQRNAIRHCRTVEHIDPPRAHTAGSTAFRTIARSQLSDCRFGFSRHPRPRSRHSGHDHANCHTPGANCSFHQISRTRLSLSSKRAQNHPARPPGLWPPEKFVRIASLSARCSSKGIPLTQADVAPYLLASWRRSNVHRRQIYCRS